MRRNLLIVGIILLSVAVKAQESLFTLSGGYVFTNIEEFDANATGFRINGSYEFNPSQGKIAHGFSVGYIFTTATGTSLGQPVQYRISTVPVYYAPKFLFGNESMKGFVKGIIGTQGSDFTREGTVLENGTWDFGLYVGASVGGMKSFGEKLFVNLEYEWAYMGNSLYRDGFINTIMGGIGFRF